VTVISYPSTHLYFATTPNSNQYNHHDHDSLSITTAQPSWNYRYNVEDPTQVAEGLGVPHTVEVNAIWYVYFLQHKAS